MWNPRIAHLAGAHHADLLSLHRPRFGNTGTLYLIGSCFSVVQSVVQNIQTTRLYLLQSLCPPKMKTIPQLR